MKFSALKWYTSILLRELLSAEITFSFDLHITLNLQLPEIRDDHSICFYPRYWCFPLTIYLLLHCSVCISILIYSFATYQALYNLYQLLISTNVVDSFNKFEHIRLKCRLGTFSSGRRLQTKPTKPNQCLVISRKLILTIVPSLGLSSVFKIYLDPPTVVRHLF